MLINKIVCITASLLIVSTAISHNNTITCPTVETIKHEELLDWLPLYKEGEELASTLDVMTFRQHITHFDVAKWSTEYLENAHCFYRGDDPMVDRIVLAQDAWRPLVMGHWAWLIPYQLAECRSFNVHHCLFIR